MAEGKLLTSGTPLFLKSRFGVGYHLTVVKGEDCISEAISDIVLSQVDGSQKVHAFVLYLLYPGVGNYTQCV